MQFGAKPLFENISVKFGEGNRYGLIGANGCGKSTFMKILDGSLAPSSGNVSITPNERIGKLHQDQFAFEQHSVVDTVIMGHSELWQVKQERDRLYSLPEMSDEEGMRVADLEIQFAEMDGYSAAGEIRRRQAENQLPEFPVIALTANAIEGDREKCLVAGMNDYLTKPFKPRDLHDMLKKWLHHGNGMSETPLEASTDSSMPIPIPQVLSSIQLLEADYGKELLKQVIKTYLDNAGRLMQTLENAWNTGDLKAIQMTSHMLKSSSAQVGANDLAELFRNVENDARSQRYDASGQTLASIQDQFSLTCSSLATYLE